MKENVNFELLWSDMHLLQVRVSAWNGKFGGVADVYLSIGGLAETALKLEGFPCNQFDVRDLQFGDFGPDSAGGAVKMRFECKDAAGHSFVETWIESDQYATGHAESAHVCARVEANAVDRFMSELRAVEASLSGAARLDFVPADS